MLKFVSNFAAMFLLCFLGFSAIMGGLYGLIWVAVHFGGAYGIPLALLTLASGLLAAGFAKSEMGK